jgi:hypothetical protein
MVSRDSGAIVFVSEAYRFLKNELDPSATWLQSYLLLQ